jgi:phytoene dehydrogenase-like protein
MAKPVVVIGGGQHGLVAAAELARRGRTVRLLEADAVIGGLCARRSFAEGYAHAGLLRDEGLLDAHAWSRLKRHGLRERTAPVVQVPRGEATSLLLTGSSVEGAGDAESARLSALMRLPKRLGPLITEVMTQPPPRGGFSALKQALRLRRVGRDDLYELMRVMPTSAADWLRDMLEDDALRAAIALPGLLGAFCGPRAPWSAGQLLVTEARRGAYVAGGAAAFVAAAAADAEAAGVEILCESPVARIVIERQAVCAVELESGERIDADAVVATTDPKTTLGKLVGAPFLTDGLAEDTRRIRARGTTAHLALALSAPLHTRDGAAVEALRTPATLDDLERAMDPVRHGRVAERLALDVSVPSIEDPSLCPDGHAVVTVLVHGVPASAIDDAVRERVRSAVIQQITEHCPDLPDQIVAHELVTPADIAARHRIAGGHLHHAEHAPDQLLFMRPSVDCARYATPIAGLFLGGSGSHPGGGLTATAGRLAAGALLATR